MPSRKSREFSFSQTPYIKRSRSRFDLSFEHKTSTSVGRLIPFYVQEVYPADTFNTRVDFVSRLTSEFIKLPLDNLFADFYFFFVPNRLTFNKWANVLGNDSPNAWEMAEAQLETVPTLIGEEDDIGIIVTNSVADYMGLPVGCKIGDDSVSILPFRGFALIYDQWFRDENLVDPMNISLGSENGENERINYMSWSANNYCGLCPNIAKTHDYFTSALPSAQKGVPISLFEFGNGYAPLQSYPTNYPLNNGIKLDFIGGPVDGSYHNALFHFATTPVAPSGLGELGAAPSTTSPSGMYTVTGSNLGIDLENIQGININDLRYAFQVQKLLERQARGGSRYQELLASEWGVFGGDARLQRTEYLGGKRVPLRFQQVVQSSGSTIENKLGQIGGFSLSSGNCGFKKSFVEHGFIIGCMALRQRHTYSQGVERFWTRKKRLDYYNPVFANIGETPIMRSELYVEEYETFSVSTDVPFGYNEAWADLRYRPSRLSGDMRIEKFYEGDPNVIESEIALGSVWTFGDYYSNAPVLSQQFVEETPQYFDRTVTVKNTQLDNFMFDFNITQSAFRELPTYSVPSLIDHN